MGPTHHRHFCGVLMQAGGAGDHARNMLSPDRRAQWVSAPDTFANGVVSTACKLAECNAYDHRLEQKDHR